MDELPHGCVIGIDVSRDWLGVIGSPMGIAAECRTLRQVSFLAHRGTKTAAIHAAKANRAQLADNGMGKLEKKS